jgi:hypothetical protein
MGDINSSRRGHAARWPSPRFAKACCGLLCLCFVGCSDLAKVSGSVSLDDKPLIGGRDQRITVMFVSESGSGATAAGLVDANGRYTLYTGTKQGIQPGSYLVGVSAVEVIRSKDESAPPAGRRITPNFYADPNKSGFRTEVQAGSNTFDINLRSDAKTRS